MSELMDNLIEDMKKHIIELLDIDFWGGNLIYNAKKFEILKKLKEYNEQAYKFLRDNFYNKLYDTNIWKRSKEQLFDFKTDFRMCQLHCFFCKREIVYDDEIPYI